MLPALNGYSPCDIDEVWPMVRDRAIPWLNSVDGGEEQILQECREKRAFCWRSADAIVVLSLAPATGGGTVLFVRAMVSFGLSQDAVDQVIPFLDRVATDLGALKIRFRTQRAGWPKLLGHRWRVSHVEYETDVSTA